MDYRLARAEFISKNAVILLGAVGFAVLLVGLSLSGTDMPLGGVILASLLLSVVTHAVLWSLRVQFNRRNWEREGTVAHRVGGAGAILQICTSAFAALFAIVFFGGMLYFLVLYGDKELRVTTAFYAIIISFAAYLLVIRHVVTTVGTWLSKKLSASLPNYEVTSDAVMIDFNMIGIGKRAREMNQKVRIGFDELDEVKAMSFLEAKQYAEFVIGPNVQRGLQNITDIPLFMAGKIPRPRAYRQIGSGGMTLVLRGPEILYLVTVNKEDCSDLVQAFETYKSKNPRP